MVSITLRSCFELGKEHHVESNRSEHSPFMFWQDKDVWQRAGAFLVVSTNLVRETTCLVQTVPIEDTFLVRGLLTMSSAASSPSRSSFALAPRLDGCTSWMLGSGSGPRSPSWPGPLLYSGAQVQNCKKKYRGLVQKDRVLGEPATLEQMSLGFLAACSCVCWFASARVFDTGCLRKCGSSYSRPSFCD